MDKAYCALDFLLPYPDKTFICFAQSPVKALHIAAFYFGKISAFYKRWGFTINAAKSQAICFRNAAVKCPRNVVQESKSLQLTLDGINIPFKNNIKCLGVQFVKLLKFNKHAQSMLEKTKRITGAFATLMNNRYISLNTILKY